ncbi:hypothetical protein ACFQMF_06955 [Halorubrum rutilum]|uniref:Uncharacterized protein n=1 Tax=Halorubrum rutilum TaxID=1364933 RepID=A0ABD6AJX3_9EURY|nr:hypothetical protein [Halorubrum rutilum]
MRSTPNEAKYHVVCRECPVERLFGTGSDATALERTHAEATGHRVAVGRVE